MKAIYKIIFIPVILMILTFSVMWNFCIPDGCTFISSQQACSTSSCVGENVFDHIQERANLFSVLPGPTIFTLLSIIFLIASLFSLRSLLPLRFDKLPIGNTFIRYFESKLFDPILDALSNGRLNPKIYPSH